MSPILPPSFSRTVHPLFGDALRGPPHVFDLSAENPVTLCDTTDFAAFQSAVEQELKRSGRAWGIGLYLEARPIVLRRYPQMITEKRIYHAGLDITAPAGTPLFAPLHAAVHRAGKEEGLGNYGGYAVLRHALDGNVFFSFFGHLRTPHIVEEGDVLAAGERFAMVGDGTDSGGWFTHTHLQILTERALEEGRMLQGYVAERDLPRIAELFPPPYPLFRY